MSPTTGIHTPLGGGSSKMSSRKELRVFNHCLRLNTVYATSLAANDMLSAFHTSFIAK
jgi:hypothetical protein